MRLFNKFSQAINESVMDSLYRWMFGQLAALNTVMLAYNLMSLLRQVLLKTSVVKHSSNPVQHTCKRCVTNCLPRRHT